jgi:hypothetical protein
MKTVKILYALLTLAAILYLLNFRLMRGGSGGSGGSGNDSSSSSMWTVYGTNGCGWTRKQLAHMKSKGIPHRFVDCDKEDCGDITAFPTLKKSGGDDDSVIVGFKDL